MAYLMLGIKRGKILIDEGFRYQKNRETKEKIHWRCWKTGCRAKLSLLLFDLTEESPEITVLEYDQHNHATDEAVILEQQVFNSIRQEVKRDPTVPTRRSFDKVVADFMDSEDGVEDLPDFHQMKSKIQRLRSSLLPPIPHSIDDVEINGEWGRTWSHRPFLSLLDNNWGILLFVTEANLKILQRCTTIYIDGTFRTCPKPYMQMVTIHGKYLGQTFSLCMALLTTKEAGAYRQLLQHLKRRVRNTTHHRFSPEKVVCDFEMGLKNAIETELPNTRVVGCYFHFCQSLWRKIQELGLSRTYSRRRHVRMLLRKLMAIGYLPVNIVRQNFNMIQTERRTRRLIGRYHAIQEFLNYFRNTYIDGQFPIALWNVFERGMDCRTNNIVEGFHSKWNRFVGTKHPSLWIFIRKLKDEERSERRRIRTVHEGRDGPKMRRKWRKLEKRIKRLKREYRRGIRNADQYWGAMTYVVKSFD